MRDPHVRDETWHLVTCELPPRLGGVADFTAGIASALAAAGEQVHVWAPAPADPVVGLTIHELPDLYSMATLRQLDRRLDALPGPRRLFVQWVPHGYSRKSLNLPFCWWVRRRATRGDVVDVMVHEPFLPFAATRLRQNAGAVLHRVMLATLLQRAARVFVSTPSYARGVSRYARCPEEYVQWLPLSTPVPRVDDAAAVAATRARLAGTAPLVGHFGTCDALVAPALERALAAVVARCPEVRIALMGRGTREFAGELTRSGFHGTVVCSGPLAAHELSLTMQSVDVFIQPYPDGLSTRRTTLMALLDHARPVVTWPGLRTEPFWGATGAVVLTPAGDPESLGDAAVALLGDDVRAASLGAAARACYDERFGLDRATAILRRSVTSPRAQPAGSLGSRLT